jgi:thymidylate synthase ThyX
MFQAKIIADSISSNTGKRIATMQLRYPRFVHAEFMTHRVFSRNASSSRAIPVAKMIEQVRNDPAMPIHWGKNQPGMQADVSLDALERDLAISAWCRAAWQAANNAEEMAALGAHKQVANRILEPFQWISVIVTATEWDNFFGLRDHKDAQPEIRHLAVLMKQAMDASIPDILEPDQWHLPYVTDEDRAAVQVHLRGGPDGLCIWTDEMRNDLLRKISAARCCRVSYLKHDGNKATLQEELDLCDRLAGSRPIHASPFEHQATPDTIVNYHIGNDSGDFDVIEDWNKPGLHGNLVGWIQHRKLLELSFKK